MPSSAIRAQAPEQPIFRSSVAVVPITAVVRDSRKRVIRNLAQKDFQVLEQGTPRRIIQFSANDDGPVSVAFLFDTSGSMGIVSNLEKGKQVVAQVLTRMNPAHDEGALYTFHRSLREEVPFTSDRSQIQSALEDVSPWGLTSLYDAVAESAKRLAERAGAGRALVVISDGLDTSSVLAPYEVAALASSIDVPVYVVAVVSPLDDPSHKSAVVHPDAHGGLLDLAELTGGDVFYVSALDPVPATDALMAAMRHQYFLAIESSASPGQYALDVRTKKKGLTVRARRAYSTETMVEGLR
jgi:VWFA-related protein